MSRHTLAYADHLWDTFKEDSQTVWDYAFELGITAEEKQELVKLLDTFSIRNAEQFVNFIAKRKGKKLPFYDYEQKI